MELGNRNADLEVISERNKTKIAKRLENYKIIYTYYINNERQQT